MGKHTKPGTMNTYKIASAKACRICTCKMLDLKPFRMNTCRILGEERDDGTPGG